MGKWIYLIGLLSSVEEVGFLAFIVGAAAICMSTWYYSKEHADIAHLIRRGCDEESIKEYELQNKSMRKNIKISIIVSLTGLLIATLIPSKQDMYVIALTKDVEAGQIYEMSKEELKSGIDYFFEKLDGLNK